MRALTLGLTGTAVTILAAWLLGRLLSDRYAWSQWLLWIPTPAALIIAALGLLAACRPGPDRRRRLVIWGTATAAIVIYFGAVEHRFGRWSRREPGVLRLVNGSVHATSPNLLDHYGEYLTGLKGDVTVVSTLLPPVGVQGLADRMDGLGERVVIWPFVLATRLPILEARPLVANRDIFVAIFRIDVAGRLDRPLTIYAVDLPSDPRRGRHEVARAARRTLDAVTAAAPDVVVGDFNMTRGSASLRALFPDLEHAWDQAGRGYGATFRRDLPLYHIDHALLGWTVRATSYELVDPGDGRHLFQIVELTAD